MSTPIEPVSAQQFRALLAAVTRAHGPVGLIVSGLAEADRAKGRRRVSPEIWEMWTKDKKKITINAPEDGGLIVSCAKTPDPDYPI